MMSDKAHAGLRVTSQLVATPGMRRVKHRSAHGLEFAHYENRVRNPRQGKLKKKVGPGAGIEFASHLKRRCNPASREPQSLMLPLHHPGHDFCGEEADFRRCLISLSVPVKLCPGPIS